MEIKPILFNTPMVQAIITGRKTCTRRVIKPHYKNDEYGFQVITNAHTGNFVRVEKTNENGDGIFSDGTERIIAPPYEIGDILWVRETWTTGRLQCKEQLFYKADENALLDGFHVRWHPSLHMPKTAARIFLRVTDIRAERLQDIECIASEGVAMLPADNKRDPRCYFTYLWDSTIKKKDIPLYGWNANPWVWVIKFERCQKPERWPKC